MTAPNPLNPTQEALKERLDKEPPYIVWIASYKNRKARITSRTKTYPGWIHEHAQEVKWKRIVG